MDVEEVLHGARDALTVRRVFGEPYERDGVTVIPVATVQGGGGAGQNAAEGVDGSGGGFGLSAQPAGVYVLTGGTVRWEPALDVTRIALGGELLVVVALLVTRSIVRARRAGPRR